MTKYIDAETLISLVECRPAIWDKTIEAYKDKGLRVAAWKEICNILNKKFEVMGSKEKDMYMKIVIKKWNHIRDSWLRSINTMKRSKAMGMHVKKYRYNQQMLFLKKILDLPPTQRTYDFDQDTSYNNEIIVNVPLYGNAPNTSQNEEVPEPIVPSEPMPNAIPIVKEIRHKTPEIPAKRFKKKEVIRHKPKMICNKMMSYIEDRHMSFFKSLIPSLALLDDDQTLLFQSGVINLVQNIKRGNNGWEQPSTSNYYQSSQGLIPPHYHVHSSPSSNDSPTHTEDNQPSPEINASNLSDSNSKTQENQKGGTENVIEDILTLVKIEMKE